MTKEKLTIELIDYDYQCADGCCNLYGTNIIINGVELEQEISNIAEIDLELVLQHLGYDVEIIKSYRE